MRLRPLRLLRSPSVARKAGRRERGETQTGDPDPRAPGEAPGLLHITTPNSQWFQ